jgi:hypothetical protein
MRVSDLRERREKMSAIMLVIMFAMLALFAITTYELQTHLEHYAATKHFED